MRIADVERAGRVVAEWLMQRTLARLPVSPLALTLSGTLFSVIAAALLALGYLPWAGGLMLFAGAFDAVDGALARVTGRQSDAGAFLDATMDRCSEILIGLGLLAHLLQRGAWPDVVLLYLFLSGSLLFSYIRARAEAQGFHAGGGLLTRSVRVPLLALGLLAGQLYITLWVLAVGVQLSALFRLLGVCVQAQPGCYAAFEPSWPRWLRDRWSWRARRRGAGNPPEEV